MRWSHKPKLPPSLLYFPDVAGSAGRRTRPVRVAGLDDSSGLDGVPRWVWLGSFTLVGGNLGKVRERGRRRGCLHVDHGRKRREGIVVRKYVGGGLRNFWMASNGFSSDLTLVVRGWCYVEMRRPAKWSSN